MAAHGTYIDAFILPVRKDGLDLYWKAARASADLFKEFGAISVVECLADDTPYGEVTSFPRAVVARDDEVVVLSWIIYPDKATRDASVARQMQDPRMEQIMKDVPVDGRRMIIGGFSRVLEA